MNDANSKNLKVQEVLNNSSTQKKIKKNKKKRAVHSSINKPIKSALKTYQKAVKNKRDTLMTHDTIQPKYQREQVKPPKTEAKKMPSDSDYRRLGIYLAHPISYKRCENCVHYIGNACSAHHRTETSLNHACKKFKGYQVFNGGGFSPR